MTGDLSNVTQYELTTAIALNIHKLDLKDSAIKLLVHLSAFYPNVLQTRKSLLKKFPEATLDRALKELETKALILRVNNNITLNLSVIYRQFEGKKVLNLMAACPKKQDITNKNNKHEHVVHVTHQNECVVPSFLSGLGLTESQKQELLKIHDESELKKYAEYVKNSNTKNPIAYFKWCLKEKPEIQQTTSCANKPKYDSDAERYAAYMMSNTSNWMNNKQFAETFLINTSQFDLKRENVLKDCIAIMLKWKFDIEAFSALSLIDEAAAMNQDFKNKTIQLTAQVIHDLKTAEKLAEKHKSENAKISVAAC